MAKQTLGQGDSNVLVRNQVIYGALPQDVIDRMGDTTLALQTTEQNVLPAINELKSNLTDLQVYSTTEKVIGTWIDGKPIYRKVYTGNTTASGSIIIEQANNTNIGTIIHAYGAAKSQYTREWNIPFMSNEAGYMNLWARNTSNNQIYLYFGANYGSTYTFIFVLEYTKPSS